MELPILGLSIFVTGRNVQNHQHHCWWVWTTLSLGRDMFLHVSTCFYQRFCGQNQGVHHAFLHDGIRDHQGLECAKCVDMLKKCFCLLFQCLCLKKIVSSIPGQRQFKCNVVSLEAIPCQRWMNSKLFRPCKWNEWNVDFLDFILREFWRRAFSTFARAPNGTGSVSSKHGTFVGPRLVLIREQNPLAALAPQHEPHLAINGK